MLYQLSYYRICNANLSIIFGPGKNFTDFFINFAAATEQGTGCDSRTEPLL